MAQRQHQRFSWQAPLEEEAPAYEQVQRQQPLPHQIQTSPADTANRHFSYAQTPAELRAFVYTSSPSDPPLPQSMPISLPTSPYTPIDPRPQSILAQPYPQVPPAQSQVSVTYVPPSHSQDEKSCVSPISPNDTTPMLPFSPVSPMPPQQPIQQPQATATEQSRHARQMSNLSPINTSVNQRPMPTIPASPPLPYGVSPTMQKGPFTPLSAAATKGDEARDGNFSPSSRKSYAHEPYSPHGFSSTQTGNFGAVFSPDAATGPNGLDFALHQPGQISHPNMESGKSKEWSNSLGSCSPDAATCITGLFCPCVIYGRTSYRLSQKSEKKDPTDMLGHSTTNGHCMVMGLSCGLWWLFPMLQRTRIRHLYKITGSLGDDCLKGLCCCCCVAVQNEREVKSREEASRRWAGPASTDVYSRPGGMVYKPQQ